RTNVLVLQAESPERWYRFHPLMKEFLNRQPTGMRSSSELHIRAAEWFRSHERPIDAFEHALLADNQKLAAEIVGEIALGLFFSGAGSTIIRMTERLAPEIVAAEPEACVARAYAHVMRFEFDEANRFLEYANDAVHTGPKNGEKVRQHDPLRDRLVAGQIAAAEASIATFERNLPRCITRSLDAIDLLGSDSPDVLEIAHVSLGTAYWGQGDLSRAFEAFQQVDRRAGQKEISLVRYMAVCNASHVLIELGRLDEAEAMLRSTLERWPAPSGQDYPFAAMAYTGLTEIALLRCEAESAQTNSAIATSLADTWGSVELMLSARSQAARAAQAVGDSEACGSLIAEARELAISRSNDWWLNKIDSQQARFMARRSEPDNFVDSSKIPQVDYENLFNCLTFAEVLIEQQKFMVAGELIDEIEKFSAQGGNRIVEASAKSLRLLLSIRAGTPHDAELQEALSAAAPNRTWRLLLKHGTDITDVLSSSGEQLAAAGASELLGLLEDKLVVDEVAERFQLSERELEVFELIYDGLSNDEIGEKLFVAQSTIKTHINRLYRKIDVSTRAQAVSWAAQNGLFSK
ncbi:MAG: LuxR C-terminal-related transcriptional regulator, partial [Dehalococcoidia bacterium]